MLASFSEAVRLTGADLQFFDPGAFSNTIHQGLDSHIKEKDANTPCLLPGRTVIRCVCFEGKKFVAEALSTFKCSSHAPPKERGEPHGKYLPRKRRTASEKCLDVMGPKKVSISWR